MIFLAVGLLLAGLYVAYDLIRGTVDNSLLAEIVRFLISTLLLGCAALAFRAWLR